MEEGVFVLVAKTIEIYGYILGIFGGNAYLENEAFEHDVEPILVKLL